MNKESDTNCYEKDIKIFFQAQEDIKYDIFQRREELIARNSMSKENYQRYKKLKEPFINKGHSPDYWSRGYTRRKGLPDSPAPSREHFLKYYRAHYDLLNI